MNFSSTFWRLLCAWTSVIHNTPSSLTQEHNVITNSSETAGISSICRWYIHLWSSQMDQGKLHAQIALQSCEALRSMYEAEKTSFLVPLSILHPLCEKLLLYLTKLLVFGSSSELIENDKGKSCDSVNFQIPTIVTALNSLSRSYYVSVSPYKINSTQLSVTSLSTHLNWFCYPSAASWRIKSSCWSEF